MLGGPILASMYTCCAEVQQGRNVVYYFTVFRVAIGIGQFVGPLIGGEITPYLMHMHVMHPTKLCDGLGQETVPFPARLF